MKNRPINSELQLLFFLLGIPTNLSTVYLTIVTSYKIRYHYTNQELREHMHGGFINHSFSSTISISQSCTMTSQHEDHRFFSLSLSFSLHLRMSNRTLSYRLSRMNTNIYVYKYYMRHSRVPKNQRKEKNARRKKRPFPFLSFPLFFTFVSFLFFLFFFMCVFFLMFANVCELKISLAR